MSIEKKLEDLSQEIRDDIDWEIEGYNKAKKYILLNAGKIADGEIENPAIIAGYVADMQKAYAKIKELNERLEMVKHLQGKL